MDHLIFIIILHIVCLRVNQLKLLSNHTHSDKVLLIIIIRLSFIGFSLVTLISFNNRGECGRFCFTSNFDADFLCRHDIVHIT
ncbi:hypothetical protein Hdeb2414_s0022g00609961 [Helianthus debilis subsp. tardiflorus]